MCRPCSISTAGSSTCAAVAKTTNQLSGASNDNSHVVLRTSRDLISGANPHHSLTIARSVSAALVEVVQRSVAEVRPAFLIAKGGITSSDTATAGLAIRRAWTRGTMLPGIVSLWEPISGPADSIPFIVFPGNVGDDNALGDVVDKLHRAS